MEGFLLTRNVMVGLFQAPIRNSRQVLRHRYADFHAAFGFLRAMIFVGPPDARANALTSGNDKMLSQVISAPGYPANPGWIPADHRNAFVKYFDLVFDAFGDLLFKHYPVDISFSFKFELSWHGRPARESAQLRIAVGDLGN